VAHQHNPTELSGPDEVAYLNALDPHATTTTKPWELEISSKFLRTVAVGWVVLVMAVHFFHGLGRGRGVHGRRHHRPR